MPSFWQSSPVSYHEQHKSAQMDLPHQPIVSEDFAGGSGVIKVWDSLRMDLGCDGLGQARVCSLS